MSDPLAGLTGSAAPVTSTTSTATIQPAPAAAATPPAPDPQQPSDNGNGGDQAEKGPVPYTRFEDVTRQKNEAQARLAELEAAEAERQRAAMSEQERLTADLTSAQTRAAEEAARAVLAERSMDTWKLAHAAGFRHPDDAVTFLRDRLPSLDGPALQQAVAQLAEQRPDLIGNTGAPPAPTAFGQLSTTAPPPVRLGDDGKPDERASLGADLMQNLFGKRTA